MFNDDVSVSGPVPDGARQPPEVTPHLSPAVTDMELAEKFRRLHSDSDQIRKPR